MQSGVTFTNPNQLQCLPLAGAPWPCPHRQAAFVRRGKTQLLSHVSAASQHRISSNHFTVNG